MERELKALQRYQDVAEWLAKRVGKDELPDVSGLSDEQLTKLFAEADKHQKQASLMMHRIRRTRRERK